MSDREGTGRSSRTKARPTNETGFRRLQTRGEQLLHWFPEVGKHLLREGEPGLESILGQLQSLRGQVSRRAQETGRDIEARAERILADIERQAARGLRPLLARANLSTRAEVETLERRLAQLEARLGPLLDERVKLGSRVQQLERQFTEVRADVSERLSEITLALAASDDVRKELGALREHLDSLSKEQVARSLELGRLHDRVVRLEMRFGDFLKEHGAQLSEQETAKSRLATVVHELQEVAQLARGIDPSQLAEVGRHMDDAERTLKQVELRLGDLTERHTAAREELTALAARISQVELSAARPASSPIVSERAEGH